MVRSEEIIKELSEHERKARESIEKAKAEAQRIKEKYEKQIGKKREAVFKKVEEELKEIEKEYEKRLEKEINKEEKKLEKELVSFKREVDQKVEQVKKDLFKIILSSLEVRC